MGSQYLESIFLGIGAGLFIGRQFRFQQTPANWFWVASTVTFGSLIGAYYFPRDPRKRIHSPKVTALPKLNSHETTSLAYPPDTFPGSRDVDSPYGTLRVYEWGPVDGERILFVHGISTPCLALGGVAHGLVERGYRVMLFDLWGRGYSDNPQDLPQDERLFASAILIALSSSNLCWTGSSSFAIVGYSLGGGIATNFTSYFPSLVSSLILIAPSGLVRKGHVSKLSKLLYASGILPESLVESIVKRRLAGNPSAAVPVRSKDIPVTPTEVDLSTSGQSRKGATNGLTKVQPEIVARNAVKWQVQHHQGFVKAFISSIRNGPIHSQHHRWHLVGNNFANKNPKPQNQEDKEEGSPRKAHVLLICGDSDPIVLQNEVFEDAKQVLGSSNVELHSCNAGHELPMTHSGEIVDVVGRFLQRA